VSFNFNRLPFGERGRERERLTAFAVWMWLQIVDLKNIRSRWQLSIVARNGLSASTILEREQLHAM